jgi:hypothetical protein
MFFWWSFGEWNNVYAFFYLPVMIIRAYIWTTLSPSDEDIRQWAKNTSSRCDWTDLYYSYWFPSLSSYMQICGWTIFVVALLSIRTTYYYGQIAGWGTSPCGESSCNRNTSYALRTSIPPTMYNPTGWFPRGEERAYDELGLSSYIFCDFREHCRWADDTKEEVKTYELLTGGCMVNYDQVVPNEQGFITKRAEDYPNPGIGVRMGWSACRRANDQGGTGECRGNYRQTRCPIQSNNLECNTTISINRYWKGKQVCSVCALYRNAYKSLIGGVNGLPEFKDPEMECAPKPDASINPWCFVCPGDNEAIDLPTLKKRMYTQLVLILEPFVCMALITAYVFSRRSSLDEKAAQVQEQAKKEQMDQLMKSFGDDGGEGSEGSEGDLPVAIPISISQRWRPKFTGYRL